MVVILSSSLVDMLSLLSFTDNLRAKVKVKVTRSI